MSDKTKMTTSTALRTYFEPTPSMQEMKELREGISKAEWDEMGKQTCEALGVEWQPPAK